MNLKKKLVDQLQNALSLIFPLYCSGCGDYLQKEEKIICTHCLFHLPRVSPYDLHTTKPEDLFAGKIPIQRVFSWFYYQKESSFSRIIHRLKYKGEDSIGIRLGQLAAVEMKELLLMEKIDYLIPIPLHRKRLQKRGYNQAELIALGLSAVIGIPILNNVIERTAANSSQTKKNLYQRWNNTSGIFKAHPLPYDKCHVLLIDDILTTGATLAEAGKALLDQNKDVAISIFTLAYSHRF